MDVDVRVLQPPSEAAAATGATRGVLLLAGDRRGDPEGDRALAHPRGAVQQERLGQATCMYGFANPRHGLVVAEDARKSG
jgi:hypothetical protein